MDYRTFAVYYGPVEVCRFDLLDCVEEAVDEFRNLIFRLEAAFVLEHPDLGCNIEFKMRDPKTTPPPKVDVHFMASADSKPLLDFLEDVVNIGSELNRISVDINATGLPSCGGAGYSPMIQDPSYGEVNDLDYDQSPFSHLESYVTQRISASYIRAVSILIPSYLVELGSAYQSMTVKDGIFIPDTVTETPRHWYIVSTDFAQAAKAEGDGDKIFEHPFGLLWSCDDNLNALPDNQTVQRIFNRMGVPCPWMLPC